MTVTAPQPAGSVVDAIKAAAARYGVDPRLALADAQQESGLNPMSVGDQGTSFGLYQLHRGGELGNLTPAQAFDPATNADTALAVFAQVQAKNPTASPGQIAALAERPANPAAYAAAVNAIYANPAFMPGVAGGAGGAAVPAAGPAPSSSSTGSGSTSTPATQAGFLGSVAGDVAKAWYPVLAKVAFIVAGLALVGLGFARLFPGVTRTVNAAVGKAPIPIPV